MNQEVIMRVELDSGETTPVVEGSSPRYLESGHLVWATPDQTVVMAPFDPEAVQITGAPVPVADDIALDQFLTLHVAFSSRGDLVYQTGGSVTSGSLRMSWIDRSGTSTDVDPEWTIQATQGGWDRLSLSPDGNRVVVTDGSDGVSQLWVKDLTEDTPPFRITFEGGFNARPAWTPDGDSLVYISDRGGSNEPTQLWQRAADGSGEPRLLLAADREIEEVTISADGAWLIYRLGGTATNRDIYGMRLGVDTVGTPLVATDADEKSPALSPDGRWLAYVSDRTGTHQVFVRPFPDVSAGRWQVSRSGGVAPVWSPTGDEVFFVGPGQMMTAGVRTRESSLAVTQREALFSVENMMLSPAGNSRAFDVSGDGERLLVLTPTFDSGERKVIWIRNWFEEWRRRADAGGS